MKILTGRGFSPENIRTLQKTYKNKFLLTNQTDKTISKGAEKGLICPWFIIISALLHYCMLLTLAQKSTFTNSGDSPFYVQNTTDMLLLENNP